MSSVILFRNSSTISGVLVKRAYSLFVVVLLVSVCGAAPTETSRAAVPKIEIEKHRLANGLDVFMVEDHRLPRVAVNVWYHVGPANEEPGRTGFAHLFEHMMFQQSKHVGRDQHF